MGAGRRARRTTIDALRGRLGVRAGHNLPILVTVAGPGPIRLRWRRGTHRVDDLRDQRPQDGYEAKGERTR